MTENSGADSSRTSGSDNNHNQKLYHWVYVAGWCLVSAAIDFGFLWPETHFWALLAFAALLSLPTIYELNVRGYGRWTIAAAVLSLFLIAATLYWIIGPIPSPEISGTLIANDEPTPRAACGNPTYLPPDNVLVLLGNNLSLVSPMQPYFIPVQVGHCPIMKLAKKDGKLIVDADAYDSDGKLLFRIRADSFVVAPGSYSYARQADLGRIAVYGFWGNVLFSVEYLNPSVIRIRGRFACVGHSFVRVDDQFGATDERTHSGVGKMCVRTGKALIGLSF